MATFKKIVIQKNGLFYPCYVIGEKVAYCSSQGEIVEYDNEKDALEYLED